VCVIGGFGIGDWNMKVRVLFTEKTFEFIVLKIEGGGCVRCGFGKGGNSGNCLFGRT
jgi:hypothetical protein